MIAIIDKVLGMGIKLNFLLTILAQKNRILIVQHLKLTLSEQLKLCFKHNVMLLALAFITFAIGDLLNRVCLPLHQPQQIGQGYQSLWICLFQQPSPGIFLDLV